MDTIINACINKICPFLFSSASSFCREVSEARKNVQCFQHRMTQLEAHAKDVLKKVHVDAGRRIDVADWISRVANAKKELTGVQQKLQSSKWFWERYSISRSARAGADEAKEMLKEVEEKGYFDGSCRLLEIDCERCPVGIESKVKQLEDFARSNCDAVIMGIYGMAGVGKNALVRRFNNMLKEKFDKYVNTEFLSGEHLKHGDLNNGKLLLTPEDHFDVVVFTKASTKGEIQQSIADRLGWTWGYMDVEGRAREIRSALERMKFLIIMVDVWDKLDLQKLGIPSNNVVEGSKVIFTTRIETVHADICNRFNHQNHKMHLRCLKWPEAWKLFNEKLGKEEPTRWSTPETEKAAKEVARRCGGLPIALNTIASIMAPKMSKPYEWQSALQFLDTRPSQLGPELDQALENLKWSFDKLKRTQQNCFYYVAMFPRHDPIPKDWLVDYLIGEGLIKGSKNDMRNARSWGHGLITALKDASLLESFHPGYENDDDDDDGNFKGDGDGSYCDGNDNNDDDYVRMHDMYRVMALRWREKKWLMQPSTQQASANPEDWMGLEKVSLMMSKLHRITMNTTPCMKLRTLLLAKNPLDEIPDSLFASTPCLRVLDLSSTKIRTLPSSVSQLQELEYLDLHESKELISLPAELEKLTSLRFLNLDHTPRLKNISNGLISSLTSLQVLRMYDSYGLNLEELKCLGKLQELAITIEKPEVLKEFCDFHPSAEVTSLLIRRCLGLENLKLPDDLGQQMSRLRLVGVFDCNDLEELQIGSRAQKGWPRGQIRGRRLELKGLDRTKIEWVIGTWLQTLEYLIITNCKIGGPLIPKMQQVEAFGGLTYLKLQNLSNLTSIFERPLFPSLRTLKVEKCPKLREFPFGAESADNIRRIHCEKEWWDRLYWDNEAPRSELEKRLIKSKKEEESKEEEIQREKLERKKGKKIFED